MVVGETARALASFTADPQGLVTACRRLVSRQPGSAPLVWLCARVLTAGDPRAEIRDALDELEDDRTPGELAHALPDDATVLVLGWPEFAAEALPRRGDVEVLVVDVARRGLRPRAAARCRPTSTPSTCPSPASARRRPRPTS